MGIGLSDNSSDLNGLGINTAHEAKVSLNTDAEGNPQLVGAVKLFSENDAGTKTGTMYLASPETNDDFQLRTTTEVMLDNETFNYVAQNTGKHTSVNTNMSFAWTIQGLTTNALNYASAAGGQTFGTYAEFPMFAATSVYGEFEGGFTQQPQTNQNIDFGFFRRGATVQFAPTDGVYFRLNSSGLNGVVNYNSSESPVAFTTPFTYTVNHKYKFLIVVTTREVEFWIDDVLYGKLETPDAQGQPCISATLPLSIRHGITGASGGTMSMTLNNCAVTLGGINTVSPLGEVQNRVLGSYQGLSGGTMGGLTNYVLNTTAASAAAASATCAAGLCIGLGGVAHEGCTIANTIDGIIMSYLNPAGTTAIQGKRLRVSGIALSSFVSSALIGGPCSTIWGIQFGHTALSLGTGEAAATKKPRTVMLPGFTQNITATQAVNTVVAQNTTVIVFADPIYVNPGEYLQLVKKNFGTALTGGAMIHTIQPYYTWE